MRSKWTLKTQLIVTYIFLLGTVLMFSMFYTYNSMMKVILKNAEEITLNKSDRIQSNIKTFQEEMEKMLMGIFLNPCVIDFSENNYGMDIEGVIARKTIGDYLDQLITINPEIESIFISKENGNTVGAEKYYNYNYEDIGQDILNIDQFGSNMPKWEGKKVLVPYAQKESFVISINQQFGNAADQSKIGIVINISEKYFRDIYYGGGQASLSQMYVCDSEGVIFSSPNTYEIGEKAKVFDTLKGQSDKGSFIYIDENNQKQQIIFYSIPSLGWHVIEEVPLSEYIKDIDFIKKNLIIVSMIGIVTSILLVILLVKKMILPLNSLRYGMQKVQSGAIGYQIEGNYYNEFKEMINCFNEMSLSMENLINTNKDIEQQKMNFALSALRTQINPHFIFNTLNMIKWMAITQEANNINDAIQMLMKFLRPVFKEKSICCSIKEEIEFISNYIELINLRFGEIIILDIQIPLIHMNKKIIRFIFQPIIENCIQHGFKNSIERGIITITAYEEKDLIICIEDNGEGMKKEELLKLKAKLKTFDHIEKFSGENIGIANVNLRLKLNYGKEYGIKIESEESKGTKVMIKIP